MRKILSICTIGLILAYSCKTDKKPEKMNYIDPATIRATIDSVKTRFEGANAEDISTGVKQVASFWIETDGTEEEFTNFCMDNFLPTAAERDSALLKISRNYEILNGYFNKMSLTLKEPLHLNSGEVANVDLMFGGFEPSSHMNDDMFKNKIAFFILLNYKFYTLAEKTNQGLSWSRKQWAVARIGELNDSRVPGDLMLKYGDVLTKADAYISEYNIFMNNLLNEKKEKLFPKGLKLISHWGLRDELKANYQTGRGLEKQRIIFSVMNHIINQDIPAPVINSEKYEWEPLSNKLYEKEQEISFKTEPNTRYEWLLKNFRALKEMDAYNPFYPTYISQQFDDNMEISQQEVEQLFVGLVSSTQVKNVAALIEKRLGRKLEPFDIWYDGFKARSKMDIPALDEKVKKLYPDAAAFEKDMPNILVKLGFERDKANYIASKIQVDASRGAGHAWGALMKGDKAHLRTRVGKDGMNYQGFNIAMHELGHCVEQTLTLYDIDYYALNGVPNTAFTEALAFVFQKRDLDVLGINDSNPLKEDLTALDIFWSNYEIMGVSLVDMNVWKWLYEHPDATKEQLKEAVLAIAKDVWNKYYAEVFGVKDQVILGIYSHMIDNPLYLSAYPIGHLIDFQIEQAIKGKNFGEEVIRIFKKGSIAPQVWLKQNFGQELSNQPLLDAVDVALTKVQ